MEISRVQGEVALCRERIASYPSKIQGMRTAMDRHERFCSELAAGFEAEKKKANLDWRRALEYLDRRRGVSLAEYDRRHRELHRAIKDLEESALSCRSREAAATARVSLLRELASAGNPAGLDVAPSYSRGRDETSRKEPDAPLEPVQPDFVTRALKETNKFEPTFGLHSKMDEFRRLKVMYLTAPTRELAEFHIFAKAMAAHREDGRGSEDRGGDNRGDTGDDQRRGRHNSRKDLKDSRERRPDDRPSAGARWDKKSDSSYPSSDSPRRDNRRRSHRRRKEINRYRSAESLSSSRSPAPKQLPTPSLPRPQHAAFPTIHHPTPSEPAPENSYALLSEISSRPSEREDANRKCYASLDTKGLMKLPAIPFDIADGNSRMNLVNFTASLKEAVAQIKDLGEDLSVDGFWIPGWHKPLMRHILNSVSHHYPAQVTRTEQMVWDAFARAEADERSGQPGRQVLEGILRAFCLGLSPSTPRQALQQLQTFAVPEKTSFADFLSELRIAVMNVKDVALVPPYDSTMRVAVKASIDDQFATLAASISAGRNRSAVPFGSVEELRGSLGDLAMNRTPATAATRLGPRKAGGRAASGSARSGNVFPVGGKDKKSKLDDA